MTALPLTYLRIELVRQLRNVFTIVFTLVLPAIMYLIFGAGASWGSQSAGEGNVAFSVMVSMGAYGAMVAMTSLTSAAAAESAQGWGRQLALTPLGTPRYAGVKVLVALAYATAAMLIVYVLGAFTGTEGGALWRWFACGAITLITSAIYGLYGLGIGLLFPSDAATGIAASALTLFAFFGNVFMPLGGVMLTIAHFTPMYGVVALARWPLTEGWVDSGVQDALWMPLVNTVVWALVFAALVALGVRRSRRRQ